MIDDIINGHFKWLKTKGLAGARANLAGMDLSGMDIPGIDLSGANLSEADLTDVNLSGAVLSGANLTRADLTRTRLDNADLSCVVLTEATCFRTNFEGAKTFDLKWAGAWLFRAVVSYDQLPGRMCTIGYVSLSNDLRLELLRRNVWAVDPGFWPRIKKLGRDIAYLPRPFKHPWSFLMPRGFAADYIDGKEVEDQDTWRPSMTDFELEEALKNWLRVLDKEAELDGMEKDDHGFYKAA